LDAVWVGKRCWRYGYGSLYIFITILFFINEDLRMSLFCSPAMIFYYWTREFNQAIVSLSGTRCTVDMLYQFDKVKMQDVGKTSGLLTFC
jgi:hypothetical protein